MTINCASPGSFTDWAEQKIVGHVVNYATWAAPSKLYIALGTGGDDEEAGDFNELSAKGYKRQRIRFDDPSTDENGVSATPNKCPLAFGPADEDWSVVNGFGIYDAVTDGNLITYGPLVDNWYVKEDQQLMLQAEEIEARLTYSLDSGQRWSKYLQEKILRHVFLGEYYDPPALYAAITHNMPNFDDTGSDLDEPTGTAYKRPLVSGWREPTKQSNWSPPYSISSDYSDGSFGQADYDWFPVARSQEYLAFADAATGGNLLAFARTSISQIVYKDDVPFVSDDAHYTAFGLD